MTFLVKNEHFEGPLDLLLTLIEKRKLFINDISLSKVADDFIEHIKLKGNIPIAESAHFILIASTLLLIKSKSLLPTLELTEDEKSNIDDLQIRLKIYQKIKEASQYISAIFGHQIIFEPSKEREIAPVFSPDESINTLNLLSSIKQVIQSLPKKENLPKAVVQKVVSLEEMIDNLTERVQKSLKMGFREFSGLGKSEKVHVIVSFLAMLELFKQGIIDVHQDDHFDEIHMETKNVGVPKYF